MPAELKLQRRNGEGCEDGHSSTGCMAERFQVCVLFTVLEHLIVHKNLLLQFKNSVTVLGRALCEVPKDFAFPRLYAQVLGN